MNWYKKAQNYMDIGHSTIDKPVDHILWHSSDGIQVMKSKKDKSLSHSQWYTEDEIVSPRYSGRYDVAKRDLSVSYDGWGDVPKSLINNLMIAFPNVKTIHIFGAEPQVIRVASNKKAQENLQSEFNLDNFEESLEYDVKNYGDLVRVLNAYDINWKKIDFPKADSIIKLQYNNKEYIIDDIDYPSLKDVKQWIYGIYDHNLDDYIPSQDFNKLFWEDVTNGSRVYHATSERYKDSILKDGLKVMDKTRGINNRSTGNAIFTSENPDDIDSYGNVVFEIDLGKMKSDGYTPNVSKEGPIESSEQRNSLAHKVGIDDMDFSSEYDSEGLYPTTIIFYNNIPAKYLRVL
jgi:hypothetical protein